MLFSIFGGSNPTQGYSINFDVKNNDFGTCDPTLGEYVVLWDFNISIFIIIYRQVTYFTFSSINVIAKINYSVLDMELVKHHSHIQAQNFKLKKSLIKEQLLLVLKLEPFTMLQLVLV